MGASVVLLPAMADSAWAPVTCFVLGALAWLLLRTRRPDRDADCGAAALAAVGVLLLAVRVAAVYPWLGSLPAAFVGGALAQAVALALLVVALAVVARRDLAPR